MCTCSGISEFYVEPVQPGERGGAMMRGGEKVYTSEKMYGGEAQVWEKEAE